MTFIPHSKPTIDSNDIAAVTHVLKSGNLVQGQKVLEFETKLSRYMGVKAALATNSGTSALHLALLALNIGPQDEVMVPSYVCTALLNAISYTGAKACIVDVNDHDFNISPADVKKKLNKKIKVIIVPHMFGHPADLKELLSFGVSIIEDCAQSIGASYQGRKLGSFGVLSICSFYATKMMTTGEGGMVLSSQTKLLDRIRDLREYDQVSNLKTRFNYKMTDVQAAMGLTQLQKLPQFIQRRRQIAQIYRGVSVDQESIYYRYIMKTNKEVKLVIERLKKKGIGASVPVFKPLHRYYSGLSCPVSDQLMKQCVSIPIYPSLTNAQVQKVKLSLT